jgi:hypothetical protein
MFPSALTICCATCVYCGRRVLVRSRRLRNGKWDMFHIPFRMQNRPQCRLRKRGRVDHLPRNTCETSGTGPYTTTRRTGRLTDHGGRPCEMRMVFFLVDRVSGIILRSRLLGPSALPSADAEGVSMMALTSRTGLAPELVTWFAISTCSGVWDAQGCTLNI